MNKSIHLSLLPNGGPVSSLLKETARTVTRQLHVSRSLCQSESSWGWYKPSHTSLLSTGPFPMLVCPEASLQRSVCHSENSGATAARVTPGMFPRLSDTNTSPGAGPVWARGQTREAGVNATRYSTITATDKRVHLEKPPQHHFSLQMFLTEFTVKSFQTLLYEEKKLKELKPVQEDLLV